MAVIYHWHEFDGYELLIDLWNKARTKSDYDASQWKQLSELISDLKENSYDNN
jgi:hypothetical protein